MKKIGNEAVLLTNHEFKIIQEYETIKKQQLKDKLSKKNNILLNNFDDVKPEKQKKDKQENIYITILGLMSALIGIIGIFNVTLLGCIRDLLEKIGGLA